MPSTGLIRLCSPPMIRWPCMGLHGLDDADLLRWHGWHRRGGLRATASVRSSRDTAELKGRPVCPSLVSTATCCLGASSTARLVFRVGVLSATMASKTRRDARGAGNLNPCNSPPQFSGSPCTLEHALWLSFDRQPSLQSPPSSVGKNDGRKKLGASKT